MKKVKALFLPRKVRASYADAGDFLRVACVGLIGWFHIWQQSWLNPDLHLFGRSFRIYPMVACGYMFVDLMLLLSGFLLMLGWQAGRNRRARDFYTARAARILPSYLLCIAIMLFGFALPEGLYGSTEAMWKDLIPHLTFTHNMFPASYSFTRLNGALWTLAVEVQFYLIFPFLARVFHRAPARTWGCMVLLAMAVRLTIILLAEDSSIYFNRLTAMLDVYANGMLAAHIYRRLAEKPQSAWRAWLSTALTILAAVGVYHILCAQYYRSGGQNIRLGQMLWRFPLSALGCVFLVCGSRSIRLMRALFSNRLVRFLSGLSFNFYIWHQFLAVKLKAWRIPYYEGENPNQAGLQPWQNNYTLLCFAAALALSLAITYLVEKPCARWIKRRASARKALETELAS
ncbi:MAG: acyltransferase family protein [Aristaeellaceae bacterium]